MKQEGTYNLTKFKNRWQLLLLVECVAYTVGAAILGYFISSSYVVMAVTLLVVGFVSAIIIKPWKPNLNTASRFLDSKLDNLEYSTELLLTPSKNLSTLAQLQQIKVNKELATAIKGVNPPNRAIKASLIGFTMLALGLLVNQFNLMSYFNHTPVGIPEQNRIDFYTPDSVKTKNLQPKIVKQDVAISYPSYINIAGYSSDNMNIKAVVGSRVSWRLQFDKAVDSVFLQSSGVNYPMTFKNDVFSSAAVLEYSGFYNFKFIDLQGNPHTSDLYSIEVTKDSKPEVKLTGIDKFTSFNFNEDKNVAFNTLITDDYGIAQASIIATVSKGSGESVKFREEQLSFDQPVTRGSKSVKLSKSIALDQMNMEPGDELYFYVEAFDLKNPVPNITRSETYFVVIKDTVSNEFAVEGNMGVDRMPDYFRSQRQLIIDTEKLIKKRGKIPAKDFKFESNELGFDQKALRLKYGAFMGEESEMEAGGEFAEEDPSEQDDHDPNDPLSGYEHDHDSDNEHNLVLDNEDEDASKNPLEEFMHIHDDSEVATLFTESLRTKLRKALNEMWDAELYLRLYEPEKSLPYQYRALKLIQDIKNSARIYVHRIGFDPPPIKEDKRLTGELKDVLSYTKSDSLEVQLAYPFMRRAILRLEQLKTQPQVLTANERFMFEQAGNELAALAVQFPGKYLEALQHLKWIAQDRAEANLHYESVQQALLLAIPNSKDTPSPTGIYNDEITQLLIKELQNND